MEDAINDAVLADEGQGQWQAAIIIQELPFDLGWRWLGESWSAAPCGACCVA